MADDKPYPADKPYPTEDEEPFPETDYSPAMQRTLKRKFDEADATGDVESVDREDFFRALDKTTKEPEGSDPSE